jgi:hypothetical protein
MRLQINPITTKYLERTLTSLWLNWHNPHSLELNEWNRFFFGFKIELSHESREFSNKNKNKKHLTYHLASQNYKQKTSHHKNDKIIVYRRDWPRLIISSLYDFLFLIWQVSLSIFQLIFINFKINNKVNL